MKLKSESPDVSLSHIIVRNDSKTLNKKGYEVNTVLTEMCKEKNIYLKEYLFNRQYKENKTITS